MSVRQISVFVQSRPGHLLRILQAFDSANVNVRGYCASDTGDYGIVRFIVDDPEHGLKVLKDQGAAVTTSDVLCVKLEDKPGELARLAAVFADKGINVTYGYSLISTYIALKVDDVPRAKELLADTDVQTISQEDLRNLTAPGV